MTLNISPNSHESIFLTQYQTVPTCLSGIFRYLIIRTKRFLFKTYLHIRGKAEMFSDRKVDMMTSYLLMMIFYDCNPNGVTPMEET